MSGDCMRRARATANADWCRWKFVDGYRIARNTGKILSSSLSVDCFTAADDSDCIVLSMRRGYEYVICSGTVSTYRIQNYPNDVTKSYCDDLMSDQSGQETDELFKRSNVGVRSRSVADWWRNCRETSWHADSNEGKYLKDSSDSLNCIQICLACVTTSKRSTAR